ncbi:hypothetical protein P3T35_001968 [Kitasatospora sp. GP30]|uniref:DUF5825 family protein n=1 Tax=Kitasatospora sp. GP30 TaxID=3035084 RepID=UPI000C712BCB|nr:DUF5825 family protein [Kitasatospora sp. GP30]MDH6139968.1 hypothetical protein [Kitasatospora sp. GP30]
MTAVFGDRAADLFRRHDPGYGATVERGIIVVHDEVDLGGNPLATLTFLAFLRVCLEEGVAVRWSATACGELDTAPLHHLWPPSGIAGLPTDRWRAWHNAFRYGLCHFRRGPGFITVKDGRAEHDVHLMLDHSDLIAAFLAGRTPLPADSLTATQRLAVDLLTAESLMYCLGDLLLTLPAHMRRWPVPFSAV